MTEGNIDDHHVALPEHQQEEWPVDSINQALTGNVPEICGREKDSTFDTVTHMDVSATSSSCSTTSSSPAPYMESEMDTPPIRPRTNISQNTIPKDNVLMDDPSLGNDIDRQQFVDPNEQGDVDQMIGCNGYDAISVGKHGTQDVNQADNDSVAASNGPGIDENPPKKKRRRNHSETLGMTETIYEGMSPLPYQRSRRGRRRRRSHREEDEEYDYRDERRDGSEQLYSASEVDDDNIHDTNMKMPLTKFQLRKSKNPGWPTVDLKVPEEFSSLQYISRVSNRNYSDTIGTDKPHGSADAAQIICRDFSSAFLKRDLLAEIPYYPKSSMTIMSTQIYMVKPPIIRDIIDVMHSSSIFNFACEKLWTSICPDVVDVVFEYNKNSILPERWFVDHVINKIWRPELKRAFISMMAVGYALVVYCPRAELDGEIAPRVLDLNEYTLEWRVDQNGQRYYTPRPTMLPVSKEAREVDRRPQFELARPFFWKEPNMNGEPNSRLTSCLCDIITYQQMLSNYSVLDHNRVNNAIIIQTPLDTRRLSLAEPRPSTYASVHDPNQDGFGIKNAESALGIQLFNYAARRGGEMKTLSHLVDYSREDASAKQRLVARRVLDPDTNTIQYMETLQPWERGAMVLPPGSIVSDFRPLDPPKVFPDTLRTIISQVCASLGVPSELLLGAGGGGVRVTSSTTSQEQLRATVMNWRETLSSMAETIYWNIYGNNHKKNLAIALARDGIVLTDEQAKKSLHNMAVKITFRPERLTYAVALDMFNRGLLTGQELARVTMTEYGLSENAVTIPMSQYDIMMQKIKTDNIIAASRTTGSSDQTVSKKDHDGGTTPSPPVKPTGDHASSTTTSTTASSRSGTTPRGQRQQPASNKMGDIDTKTTGSVGFVNQTLNPNKQTKPVL